MKLAATNPVNGQVQGLDHAKKIAPVKREKEEATQPQTDRADEAPDYRISLSDASRNAVAELSRAPAPGQDKVKDDLSESDAERLARQASAQLAWTDASISNQAVQKAVDLFT